MTCGEEGICDGGPEVSKECEETSQNCMLSKVKIGNETYDMKDCFVAPNGLNEAMRGCVHFSNNHGVCHLYNKISQNFVVCFSWMMRYVFVTKMSATKTDVTTNIATVHFQTQMNVLTYQTVCFFKNDFSCRKTYQLYASGPKLKCRVCAGENCNNPALVECSRGDTSCTYQRTKGMSYQTSTTYLIQSFSGRKTCRGRT